MAFLDWFKGRRAASDVAPQAATQGSGGGQLLLSSKEIEDAVAAANATATGITVTPDSAMRVAAVYACVRIRCGVVANMPIHIKRRVDDRVREDANDHPLWMIFRRKPNRWQTPSQFKRMLQSHLLLRGNAYALIVRSRGKILELIPLNPDRVKPVQDASLDIVYEYRRPDGALLKLKQSDVFHLVGLTLDGVNGVSVITYARETIGMSLSMERHGATFFRNGARPSQVLRHPQKLGPEAAANLRQSLDSYRSGGESEGKTLVLEEGMTVEGLTMTAEDAQWIQSREVSRTDIAMFFGIPPHMIGDTQKSTSYGTGIDSQTQGFLTFSAEDDLTTWEETINRDCVGDNETDVYARFNRKSLVRGDLKTRKEYYVAMLQWGVNSPNEVRALEDLNPREGGDVFYDPPNTAGSSDQQKGNGNEPSQTS